MNPQRIALADGRTLAWVEFGPPDGRPVLYCHGFPSTGPEAAFAAAAAGTSGARVLAPDRPGYGRSDRAPGRTLDGWVADAVALLDHLGIDTAPVIGFSGGGPYALACAARRPERFPRAATFGALDWLAEPGSEAGMAALSRLSIRLARRFQPGQAAVFHLLAMLIRVAPQTLFSLLSAGHCPADRAVFDDPQVRSKWTRALHDSVLQGAGGAIDELRLYVAERPFALNAIQVPVDLWHGLDDTVVPPAHGERLAAGLPYREARFLPGDGHFSTPVKAIGEALERMVASPDASAPVS
ncbi:MAG: alpha/beta fold hydrolase [Halofilum sp. (in: g-proteobacteria)]